MSLVHDEKQDYRSLDNLASGNVITIGSFDGIHLGHQRVLMELKNWGNIHQASTLVLSFHPAPKHYFSKGKQGKKESAGDATLKKVMGFRDKFTHLKALSVDYLCLYRFDKNFAHLSAENFVKDVLIKKLHAKHVVIGEDFRFGKGREGDISALRYLGKQYGFDVSIVPILTIDGEKVSSTRIREALSINDIETAQKLLGYIFQK
jgi:riboflavin kinase/FMN adenylyltransferase